MPAQILRARFGFIRDAVRDCPRGRRQAFHAAIDWTSAAQTDPYLRLVQEVMASPLVMTRTIACERLTGVLKRAEILPDEKGWLRLPPSVSSSVNLANLTTESDIRLHWIASCAWTGRPEETIGAGKDVIEATAKHAMIELGSTPGAKADVPGPSKCGLCG
jgi:hypothetical protein